MDWKTLNEAIGITLRPIDQWPGKLRASWQREIAPYSATTKDTIGMLRTELSMLNATNIVLQISIRPQDLRVDGLPRANAIAEHPGVILSFKTADVLCRKHFDRFTRWEHNLRALAMNLHHLRIADLYGVEGDDRQYTGWTALPPGEPSSASDVNLMQNDRDAARYLAKQSGKDVNAILDSSQSFLEALRVARQLHHPDRFEGQPAKLAAHERFIQIGRAATLLRERHSL